MTMCKLKKGWEKIDNSYSNGRGIDIDYKKNNDVTIWQFGHNRSIVIGKKDYFFESKSKAMKFICNIMKKH